METLRTKLEPLINGLEKDVEGLHLRMSENQDAPQYMKDDLKRTTERLDFLRKLWTESEKDGTLDKPIYDTGSLDYYRQHLGNDRDLLDHLTIRYTQNLIDDDDLKPNQKIKMLKNLMTVYKELNT